MKQEQHFTIRNISTNEVLSEGNFKTIIEAKNHFLNSPGFAGIYKMINENTGKSYRIIKTSTVRE
jgi:hypothetical protein